MISNDILPSWTSLAVRDSHAYRQSLHLAYRIVVAVCALAAALTATGCSHQKSSLTESLASGPRSLHDFFAGTSDKGAEARPTSDKSDDDGPKGPLALARLNERRGQMAQAERLYQSAIERFPDDPLPYHRLGVMSTRTGKLDDAEGFFRRALELAPSDPELLTDAGYFYYLCGNPAQAEQMLRNALRLEPGNARCSNNLALLLGEQGRDDECFALFRRTGTEAEAYSNMAFVYTQRSELERAVATYSHALTLDNTMRPAAEALVHLAKYVPTENLATGDGRRTPPDASTTHERVSSSRVREASNDNRNNSRVQRLISDVIDAPATVASRPSQPKAASNANSSPNNGPVLAASYQSFPSDPPTVRLPASWQPPSAGGLGTPQYRYGQPAHQAQQLPAQHSAPLSGHSATFSGNLSSNLPPARLAPNAGLRSANGQAGAR